MGTPTNGASSTCGSDVRSGLLRRCRWLVGPILTKVSGLPICGDPDGVDRARVHKQVASDVIAFFDKTFAKED